MEDESDVDMEDESVVVIEKVVPALHFTGG
jgi:hypothetical protein